MKVNNLKIIITIPAYNEEHTLPKVIGEINDTLLSLNYGKQQYKILVLDDGSVDRTAEVARKTGAIVVSNRTNRGLAETFQREMEECLRLKAEIIVHTDADGQYHPKHIHEMIQKVQKGYDLVLGSRFKEFTRRMPFLKKLGNKAFAKVISSLIGKKITDSTTGYRAFTADVAREIKFINTFTYTQEQIIKAAKQGFRITEIPIVSRRTRESRLFKSPLQYAIKAWINIFRIYRDYNPLKFFGYTGGSLFILGLLLGIFIFFEVLLTGSVGGIPRVILSALLMMVGIQIILFGFLADMIKR